ncbi:MAG: VOC family protein [Chloroflexota bacterium]
MKFNTLIPLLDVKNVEHSIEFYADALGFTIEDKLIWNGQIDWALLSSGPIRLMLSNNSESFHETWVATNGSIFFIYPEDIDSLYKALQVKGYEPSALQASQGGTREFCLQDPDGYTLWFSHKNIRELVA